MLTARLDEAVQAQIESAVGLLQRGGVVAIPTDTLYGLAARAFDAAAVQRVFDIKGRPAGMALPLLTHDAATAFGCAAEVPEKALALARAFWPGALSIVLTKAPAVPDIVCGGGDTVALRVPDHPVPREISRKLGEPITGTSANVSGGPGLDSAGAVRRELPDGPDLIIDWPVALKGVASTVVDLSGPQPRLLRPGAVTRQQIESVLSEPLIVPAS